MVLEDAGDNCGLQVCDASGEINLQFGFKSADSLATLEKSRTTSWALWPEKFALAPTWLARAPLSLRHGKFLKIPWQGCRP